jgi:2-hydroxyglutarate dehydrogenase
MKKFNYLIAGLCGCSSSYLGYVTYQYRNNTCIEDEMYDIGIIGGGIIGLATARELKLKYPNKKMIILEKENEFNTGQTGHNSGVIHAGMYYKPNSLKAKLCVEGSALTYKYCSDNNIPYKKIGKLIVATNEIEIKNLKEIYDRALKNKVVDVHFLENEQEIKKIEPNCIGLKAIHCKSTGIYSLLT